MKKFACYLSDGEILYSDNFKTIYRATISRLRDDRSGSAIFRRADHSIVCAIWHFGGTPFVFTDKKRIQIMKALLREDFFTTEWGRWNWEAGGLDF